MEPPNTIAYKTNRISRLRARQTIPRTQGEASRSGLSSCGGAAAGDLGGVGGWNGDAVSADFGEARSQPWIRLSEYEKRDEGAMVAL
jgi:hypothetical protein